MNCCRRRCFAACQSDPSRAVPVLKTIAPDTALRVVIPSADGFHQRHNVEALLLAQIHFQPTRGLPLTQAPPRSQVTLLPPILSHGLRLATHINGPPRL